MKQTALQWFIEQLEFDESMSKEDIQPVIDKALEMEKKQVIHAFNEGMLNSVDYFLPSTKENDEAKNYYNQTFKLE